MFRRISDTLLRRKLTPLAAGFVVCLMAIFAMNETLFGETLFSKVLALKGGTPRSVFRSMYGRFSNLPRCPLVLIPGQIGKSALHAIENRSKSASTSSAPGDWVSATPMPSTRNFAAASVLPSGNWLVVGGFRTGQNFLTDAAIYKPATNTWQTVGAIPTAHRYTAQLLNTGDVLVAGDDDNTAPSATSYLFTETATGGTWAATSGQPSIKRYQTSLSLLTTGALAGRVLMSGGYDNNSATGSAGTYNTTELYNPTTKSWSAGPAMITSRAFHTATVLPDGRVLVVGGFQRSPLLTARNSAELYTPNATIGSWALTPQAMATARYAHTATLLPSGEVLIVGGTDSTTTYSSVELYDPSTGQWTTKAPMTTARQLHTATLLPSGVSTSMTKYGASDCGNNSHPAAGIRNNAPMHAAIAAMNTRRGLSSE